MYGGGGRSFGIESTNNEPIYTPNVREPRDIERVKNNLVDPSITWKYTGGQDRNVSLADSADVSQPISMELPLIDP